jgi:hypothetical protein
MAFKRKGNRGAFPTFCEAIQRFSWFRRTPGRMPQAVVVAAGLDRIDPNDARWRAMSAIALTRGGSGLAGATG